MFQLEPRLGLCVGFLGQLMGPVGCGKVLLCEKLKRYIYNIIDSQNVTGHLKSDCEAATTAENAS